MILDAKFAEIRKAILYRDIECMSDLVDAIKTNTTNVSGEYRRRQCTRDWITLLHAVGYQAVLGIKKCHVITMRAGEPGKALISNLPSPTLLQNIPLSLEVKQQLPVRNEGIVVKEPEFLALNPPPIPFRFLFTSSLLCSRTMASVELRECSPRFCLRSTPSDRVHLHNSRYQGCRAVPLSR